MNQCLSDSGRGIDEVGEKIDYAAMYRPGNAPTIACTAEDPLSVFPDPNRGLMREIADALIYFRKHGRFGDPFWSRYYD